MTDVSQTVFGDLNPPYRCIVADPPWHLNGVGVTKADSRKFYSTMSVDDICALPVSDLADDSCHLWLWGINSMMEDAYRVMRAWGFSPLTLLTWCKPQPGVGNYLRNNTEHVILASKGKPMTPEVKPMATWFVWRRSAHSAKPVGFYEIVEQVSPGPRVELFCRQPVFGWDTWGKGFELEESA